jgi:hypothetical protein
VLGSGVSTCNRLAELEPELLNVTMLSGNGGVGIDAGLPGRSAEVGQAVGVLEDLGRLLKSLSSRLGEDEEDVDEGSNVEDAKDDPSFPAIGC